MKIFFSLVFITFFLSFAGCAADEIPLSAMSGTNTSNGDAVQTILPIVPEGKCPAKLGFWPKTFPAIRDFTLTKEELFAKSDGIKNGETKNSPAQKLFPLPSLGSKEIVYRVIHFPLDAVYPTKGSDFATDLTATMAQFGYEPADAADGLTFVSKYKITSFSSTGGGDYMLVSLGKEKLWYYCSNGVTCPFASILSTYNNETVMEFGWPYYDVGEDGNPASTGDCLMFLVKPKEK